MTEHKRRASLYLRISIATEESDSIERQERDLRTLAAEQGLDVVEVRMDEGISGAALDRPAYREWLADATEGRADVLLAWRFDRISREGLPAVARLIEVLKSTGARLLTFGDRMDSESGGFRLTAAVLSEVAYAEREAIRARVSSRQAADRRKGLWTRERPYGYEVREGRLFQKADEVETIRHLVSRFLDGASLRSLAAELTQAGLPTPRAAKGRKTRENPTWGLTTIRVILTSPSLTGHYPHRGTDGKVRAARDDHGELVTVTDDPILTPGEFAAIQAKLEARSALGPSGRRRPAVGAPPQHPLSGLLRCGGCGGALVFDRRRSRPGRAAFFRCQRHAHNREGCPGLFVNAAALEETIAYDVLRYVPALDPTGPEVEVLIRRWLRASAPEDDAERRAAEREYADAQAVAADLEAALYERGEFPGQAGRERWSRLYERALFRLKAAEGAVAAFPEPARNIGGLLDREVLRETLESDDEQARRSLYTLTLDRVEVMPGPGSKDLDTRVRPVWALGHATASAEPLREAPLAV